MNFTQQCNVDTTPKSHFLSPVEEDTITKSLYNANGKFGHVGVSSTGDEVMVCEEASYGTPLPISFRVPSSGRVVDIDVFAIDNVSYGLAVAVNEIREKEEEPQEEEGGDGFTTKKEKASKEEETIKKRTNSVYLYVQDNYSKFRLIREISVSGKISSMRVLVSPADMPSQVPFMSKKLAAWSNVVAIGCERCACFLGQFVSFDYPIDTANDTPQTLTSTTDALKPLIDKKGNFHYSTGGPNSVSYAKDTVAVTALSYIPCWGIMLVGLSMGGIVMVPLDGKSSIAFLRVPRETPIDYLIVLEPEYDPQGGFFVFTASQKKNDNKRSNCLAMFAHKIERSEDGDGYNYPDMLTVVIPLIDGDYWLNAHAVVRRRRRRDAESGNDSTEDNSRLPLGLDTTQQLHSDGLERTLLFFSYLSSSGEVMGGVFDLNAYYSRRCGTREVKFDEYLQHPICSQFVMETPVKTTGEELFSTSCISSVTCHSISRYSSPLFSSEPLFSPMATQLDLTLFTYGGSSYAARVESLQLTVLRSISRNVQSCLTNPDTALHLLEYTGLTLAPATRKERAKMEDRPANDKVPREMDIILRAIVSEKEVRKVLASFVEEEADRKQRRDIGRWLFNELKGTIARLDEAVVPLFDSFHPDSLSKETEKLLEYCPLFFKMAEVVFWSLKARGEQMEDDTSILRHTRRLHAGMAFDLRFFLTCVWWFTQKLPVCEQWTRDMAEDLDELSRERKDQSERQNHPLFLEALLTRLHRKTMDDPLWRGVVDPAQWYPPPLFNLLSIVRLGDATLPDRVALLIYYLMDVDEMIRRDEERDEEEKRGYPIKGSLLSLFLCSEVSEMMDGQAVMGLKERWESDVRGRQEENFLPLTNQRKISENSKLTDEEQRELLNLLEVAKRFRKLQTIDEERLKTLMCKQGYGEYRYNLYLIKKKRFPEVEDLPLPNLTTLSSVHPIILDYARYREFALKEKEKLPPPSKSNAFACPYAITKERTDPNSSPTMTSTSSHNASTLMRSSQITLVKGKTPKKLNIFKRLNESAAIPRSEPILMQPHTPTNAGRMGGELSEGDGDGTTTARMNELMRTPSMRFRTALGSMEEEDEAEANTSDIAPDEMARVRNALRTPRSRAHHGGRRMGGEGEGTPEDVQRPPVLAPMSILKSARKEGGVTQSAMKSRLRFAEVFDQKTISPVDRDTTSSTMEKMAPPNFDDLSDDDDEEILSRSAALSHGDQKTSRNASRLERELAEDERLAAEAKKRMEEEEEEGNGVERTGGETEVESSMESAGHGPSDSLVASSEDGMEMEGGGERVQRQPAGETFTVYEDHSSGGVTTDDEADAAFVEEEEKEEDGEEEEKDDENLSRGVTPLDDDEEEKEVESLEQPDQLQLAVEEEKEEEVVERREEETVETANETYTVNLANATFNLDFRGENAAATSSSTSQDETFTMPPADAAESAAIEETIEEVVQQPATAAGDEEVAVDDAVAVHPVEDDMDESNISRAVTPIEEEEKKENDAVEKEKEEDDEEKETAEGMEDAAEENPTEEAAAVLEEEEQPIDDVIEAAESAASAAAAAEEEEEVAAAVEIEKTAIAAPVPMPRTTVFNNREVPQTLRLKAYVWTAEDGVERSFEEQRGSSDEEEEEEGEEKESEVLASLHPSTSSPIRRSSSRLMKETEESEGTTRGSRKRGAAKSGKETPSGPSSPLQKKEKTSGEEEEEGEEDQVEGHLFTTTRTRVVEEKFVEREDGVMQHTVKQSTRVIETADGVIVKNEEEDRETIEEEGEREIGEGEDEDRVTPPLVETMPSGGRRTGTRSRTVSTASRVSTRGKKKDGEEEEKEEDKKEREQKASTPLRSPTKQVRRKKLMSESDDKNEEEEEKEVEEPMTPRRSSRSRKPSEAAVAIAASSPTKSPKRNTRGKSREASAGPSSSPSRPALPTLNVDDADEIVKTPTKGTRKSTRTKTPSRESSVAPSSKMEEEKKEEVATPSKGTKRSTRTKTPSRESSVVPSSTTGEKEKEEMTTPSKGVRRSTRTKTPSRETSAAPVSPIRRAPTLNVVDEEEEKKEEPKSPARRGRPKKITVDESAANSETAAAAPVVPPVPARRKNVPGAAGTSSGRKRSVSENLSKKGDEEEEGGAIAMLRKKVQLVKKEKAAMEKNAAEKNKRKTIVKAMETIPEGEMPIMKEDGPSTSREPPRPAPRKRTQSLNEMKEEMKTPLKKSREDEEESVGGQSVRRSSRKAAIVANQELKTPSKTPKKK